MSHKKRNRNQVNNNNLEGKVRKLNFQDSNSLDKLEDQIRQGFGRAAYDQMAHKRCADISKKSYSRFKNWQLIISFATTILIIAEILSSSKVFVSIAIVFSIVLLSMNSYSKGFNLGVVCEKHLYMSRNLLDLKESYLSLLTDLKSGYLSIEEIQVRRDVFQERMMEIYSGSPKVDVRIYNNMKKALKETEEPILLDEEIDIMLPESLRKGSLEGD